MRFEADGLSGALLTMMFFAILYDTLSCQVVRTEFYDLPPKGEKV